MKIAFAIVITIHALIHLLGFVKGYELAALPQLRMHVFKLEGSVWLATAILLIMCVIFFLQEMSWWWMPALLALLMSQTLIILNWYDAKFGTIPNIILLVFLVLSFMGREPGVTNANHREVQTNSVYDISNKTYGSMQMASRDDELCYAPVGQLRYGKIRMTNIEYKCRGRPG